MISFLLAAISGLILTLAYPGQNIETAVWIWLYPLLGALWLRDHSKKRAFSLGLVAGLCFAMPNLSWARHSSRVINGATANEWMGMGVEAMGWSAVLGLSLFVASFFGLWAVFVSRVAKPSKAVMIHGNWLEASLDSLRSAGLGACAWVALEWVRGWLFSGFGWNGLGVGLHHNIVLIQAADIVGVAGLSFLPVLSAGVIFNVVRRFVLRSRSGGTFRYHFDALITVIVLGAQAVYGLRMLDVSAQENIPLRVAMVQLNVPQAEKFAGINVEQHYQRFAELTQLYAPSSDLVVWPESALGLSFDHPAHASFFNDLLKASDFSLLTGCDFSVPVKHSDYTGAALLHKEYEGAKLHTKVHLVPFGEYLPLRHTVPFLDATLGQILPFDFTPGTSTEPLMLAKPEVGIIPLICFEDTVGSLARQFVREGPQLLVNMTNDGWFLQSVEPEQHLINAMFRAIELRRPMCRACNTGVTCFIDDRGRRLATLKDPQTNSSFIEGVLPSTLMINKYPPMTLYARWGDWFSILCLAVCLVGVWAFYRRGRSALS